jgi:Holliday junction DNA helicase RuvA
MITRISGKMADKREGSLVISTGSLSYEVMVPLAVMKALEETHVVNSDIELVTYHYYQVDQSRSIPVLIGFQNEVEKEFFEKFISVSGVGPKAACKALAEPFSMIAAAIDSGDVPALRRLPGIGDQKARLIVAKLQGKVGKYGLIRDSSLDVKGICPQDLKEEAVKVLLQLQYKKGEAEDMVKKAFERNSRVRSSEELLNEVYRDRKTALRT